MGFNRFGYSLQFLSIATYIRINIYTKNRLQIVLSLMHIYAQGFVILPTHHSCPVKGGEIKQDVGIQGSTSVWSLLMGGKGSAD